MRTPVAPTYLLPDDRSVTAGPWVNEVGVEVGDRLKHWDPATDIELSRLITVDLDAIREQCLLGADSSFAVTASWRAPTRTRLSGAGQPVETGRLTGVIRTPISVSIKGRDVGGRLDLMTRLVLRTPGGSPTGISPRRVGSILWIQTDRVLLEGGSARFPTAVVNFEDLPRVPDRAAWYVDWSPNDLSHPVLGGLRLLINRANPRIVNAVRSSSDDPAAPLIRSMIRAEVARQLIRGALESDEFLESPDSYPSESVGRLVRELIANVWPAMTVGSVRERATLTPGRFDSEVQAALGLSA